MIIDGDKLLDYLEREEEFIRSQVPYDDEARVLLLQQVRMLRLMILNCVESE